MRAPCPPERMIRLKRSLMVSVLCAALFLVLMIVVQTMDVAPNEDVPGTSIGLAAINLPVHRLLEFRQSFYSISKYLGYLAFVVAAAFACLGVCQLVQRKSLKKTDRQLWCLAGLYAAVLILYVLFERLIVNYRPVLLPGTTAPEASFPSTHTMLACVILGSAFILLPRLLKKSQFLTLLRAACLVLCAGIIGTRLLSGVHWLTDILAGILLSTSLLGCFSFLLDRLSASGQEAGSYRGKHAKNI